MFIIKGRYSLLTGIFLCFVLESLGITSLSQAEKIKATFFQPSKVTAGYSTPQLQHEFKWMGELGIKTVVVQWVVSKGQAYYPSKSIPVFRPDLIKEILDMASINQMEVYLGLFMPEDWFTAEKTTAYLMQLKTKAYSIVVEVYDLYRSHPAFKGWYLPYEFSTPQLTDESLCGFIINLANDIKKLTPEKQMMIAPYLSRKSIWSTQESTVWERFLSGNPIDVIALQDGVGASELQPEFASNYYKSLREVCRKTGHALWAVLELFDKNFTSALPDRVIKQFTLEGAVVDGVMIFDFSHYLNPERGEKASALNRGLKAYLIQKQEPDQQR